MKKLFNLFVALCLIVGAGSAATAKERVTVNQVSGTVTLTDDIDFVVTSAEPFASDAIVDITNTEHAVLILDSVRPSRALALLYAHVRIKGVRAQNSVNCQVKIYNRGAIILPYGDNCRPLTVFSGQHFEGEACNDFGLEYSGGFMNTLTEAKLNNQIRSFKLKRGYMVTFALRAGGRGYSRCFIAADGDMEIGELPVAMDKSISSYRIFKWYDTSKVGLAAAGGNTAVCQRLGVTSTYTWNQGVDMGPDVECVPHHIYEDYPSAATCGSATWSPHMKTNNEPRNPADDHPQDLNTILNNWENLMATGMRLCTPSSWDGSDYWNADGFIKTFLDSIDARGWRCDIVDAHCYWPEANFANLGRWASTFKRPIWISEWVWGASWNHNGAFASGVTEEENAQAVERICNNLNSWNYIERYFYWNGERDPSKLDKNGTLTAAGQIYSQLNSGIGYNGLYDYVPTIPKQGAPRDLVAEYDKVEKKALLTWFEPNGEMNQGCWVERRRNEDFRWSIIAEVDLQEQGANYSFTDAEATNGCQYRIRVTDANGLDRYSAVVMAASSEMMPGDAVETDGGTKYLGGNIFVNGDFDMDAIGWINGEGQALTAPWFQVVPKGGADNGAYLQAYGNGGINSESAVKTVFDVEKNTDYYFSGAVCYTNSVFCQLNLSTDGTSASKTAGFFNNASGNWMTQFSVFNTEDYPKVIVAFRTLGAKTQVDRLMLCRLFDRRDEALADGWAKARQRIAAFKVYNSLYEMLNTEADQLLAYSQETTSLEHLTASTDSIIAAYHLMPELQALVSRAKALEEFNLYGSHELHNAIYQAETIQTANDVFTCYQQLKTAIDVYLPMTSESGKLVNPRFADDADGWMVKCGSYTAGDQRANTRYGTTFWNAWWSGLHASEGTDKTMAVKQTVVALDHGLYALECRASTEHYCLSDQHAFITNGTVTETSPALKADFLDLPTVTEADRWQLLTTLPVYVAESGQVTVGFEGSKQGAVDGAWHELGNSNSTGDLREGWWCATDFVLKYHPLFLDTVTVGEWGVRCFPYAARPSEGMHFYRIAGITPDHRHLCLEEMDESTAGQAFIYRSDNEHVAFLEYGEAVKSASDAPGNLRGFFKVSARVPVGYYYLTDGKWVKVTGIRPPMSDFTGIIRPFTDKNSKPVDIISDWPGLTMPIEGVTSEEMAADIEMATAQTLSADGTYTIDGMLVDEWHLKPGLYIKVRNGIATKVIVK